MLERKGGREERIYVSGIGIQERKSKFSPSLGGVDPNKKTGLAASFKTCTRCSEVLSSVMFGGGGAVSCGTTKGRGAGSAFFAGGTAIAASGIVCGSAKGDPVFGLGGLPFSNAIV